MKTHSRTPSNASSTSAEVARLTSGPGGDVEVMSTSMENVPLQEDPASGWQDGSAGSGNVHSLIAGSGNIHSLIAGSGNVQSLIAGSGNVHSLMGFCVGILCV